MKIWIDLSTAPDPLFFRPLIKRLNERGHTTWLTARDFSETTAIAKMCGLPVEVIGRHGGSTMMGKGAAIFKRAAMLAHRVYNERFDVAVGFNSYAQALAARLVSIPLVTCMDYEHQPANHVAFRLARCIVVPSGFNLEALRRQGGKPSKVRFHDGLKEHVTLVDFTPNPDFPKSLRAYNITDEDVLVLIRPPATQSAYHRFENDLFAHLVHHFSRMAKTKVILLPRYSSQSESFRAAGGRNLIIPTEVLDGLNLIYYADLVISAGGSMNREAVVLGTPACTVFRGRMAGVDLKLIAEGALGRIDTMRDIERLAPAKKPRRPVPTVDSRATEQVLDAILGVT
ncbi:DUF354 domain-containing protein [Mesorhizobium sp.]|uniref:DUF354 domain-containing protein n=1 Tax=Mesorhizobium sp. TaxID=1871066 RepID=UPI000FE548E1|nr:DUF354 domain-containing protein [Mesorhizobium sp.]RWQ07257.1 MAG: DUF354 domain-containing protein [Mesorhizobium sp.]RWQ57027.1 MAG: DUF354 domain-containing protein [Mesorhizobium sp.]